jgi:hypothetical protein
MMYDEIVKVRIHAGSEQVFQDVYAFLVYNFKKPLERTVDVFIKMPLYLIPDDIHTDVTETLRAQHIFEDVEDLRYTIAPEIL